MSESIYKIKPEQPKMCMCCGRQLPLRLGYCFDCAEFESLIITGLDMYDNPVSDCCNSKAMSIIHAMLKKYISNEKMQ